MIEPVICACTTSGCASDNTNRASTSSAALPKLTFSKLPIVAPVCIATCSVPRRTQSASTAMATRPATKIQTGGVASV